MFGGLLAVGLSVGAGAGCSGGGDSSAAPLDCAWTAGENCWKTTASSATSCLPPSAETGVLSADNSTCTYTSGAVITFNPPLVLPLPSDPKFNFTLTVGGQECLKYDDNANGFTLAVGGQTVSESTTGVGLSVSCPDGMTYSNSNALSLLSCPDSSFGDLPGNAYSWTSTSVIFGLINTSTTSSSELVVFSCEKA